MRVTNSMLVSTLLRDLNNNMNKISDSQAQLSSGRRINRPSDDPVGIIDSLRLRSNLFELGKFKTNAQDAKSWLESTDVAVAEVGDVVQRVRELAVRAANGTMPDASLDAIKKEVEQLKEHVVQVANSKYGDRYLFSGTLTHTAPYDAAGIFQGNLQDISFEVGVGIRVPINVNGSQAFGNIFAAFDNLINDLGTANKADISGLRLGELDAITDNSLEVRAEVGARINRLDFAIERMEVQNVNMTDLLSKTEDADMAQLITELKMQENVYRASLSAGARFIQPSLIDFLR